MNEIEEGRQNQYKKKVHYTECFLKQETVIKFFDYYYLVISEARYEASCRKWLKLLTPNQILQRLPVALAQVKVGDKSENLLNEICQLTCSLYQTKEITKKMCNNIMNSIKLYCKKWTLYLSILEVVKHLVFTDYYSIFQI